MDIITTIRELTLGPSFFKSALKEKRNVARVVCRIKAIAHTLKGPVSMMITDVSLSGVRVESPAKLDLDQDFQLSLDTDQEHEADDAFIRRTLKVRASWSRRRSGRETYTAGLMFTDNDRDLRDSWVHYIFNRFGMNRDIFFSKRESIRIPVEIPVLCQDARERTKRGTIINIGIGGALVRSAKEIPVAEELNLTIPPFRKFSALSSKAKVLRAGFRQELDLWEMAIEFIDMQGREFKKLGRLILYLVNYKSEKQAESEYLQTI